MAKLKLQKMVYLPIGETPPRAPSYFLWSGNVTHNTWLLKRAHPAKFAAVKAGRA